jgi:preprotein translocase subunit SecG
MNLSNSLILAQIIVSVIITVVILLQAGSNGGGLFESNMGGGESFRTKRGLEKFLYNMTIVLAIVMVVLSFLIFKNK